MSEKLYNDIKNLDWNAVNKLSNGKELYSIFVKNYSKWDTSMEQLISHINMNYQIDEAFKKLEKNIKVFFSSSFFPSNNSI